MFTRARFDGAGGAEWRRSTCYLGPAWRLAVAASLVNIAVFALVAGCSGEWSFALAPLDAGAPDARFGPACKSWARAFCVYQARCESRYFAWQNVDQCADREALSCELTASEPSAVFDGDRLSSCTYPTDCSMPPPDYLLAARPRLPPAARVSGTKLAPAISTWGAAPPTRRPFAESALRRPGNPCTSSRECASGFCDAVSMRCAAFAGVGANCGSGSTGLPLCAFGLGCFGGDGGGTECAPAL